MIEVICTNCHRPYPETGVSYRCPTCGGIFDYASKPGFDRNQIKPGLPGIWRFQHTFGLPEAAPMISLGEGGTPLIWEEVEGRAVGFKLEYLNPTGSFKDRGSASLVSFLKVKGVEAAVEDSSGNAGASFAAYAARAGVQAKVFVPDSSSGPKRAQIEAYGAEVIQILGPRSNATDAVRQAADHGVVYASHAYLPFNLPGYATVAYEICEQIDGSPFAVVLPVGQGGLLLGVARGFQVLMEAGEIQRVPLLIGVQARRCAPLWAVYSFGGIGQDWISAEDTIAEGIRVRYPVRGDAILQAVSASGGLFLAVEEDEILPARDQLARKGFYVEPTSAVIWPAIKQILGQVEEPIVAILTGSGFKYTGS